MLCTGGKGVGGCGVLGRGGLRAGDCWEGRVGWVGRSAWREEGQCSSQEAVGMGVG